MDDTYNRARISVLSELVSFPTIRNKDWQEDMTPNPGSLVALSSVPETKWYLSWVIDVELHEGGWHRYLLKSLEDGELCWWENVGIYRYNHKRVLERPEWRWSDRQFAFRDKWYRVCFDEHDAYITLPGAVDFHDDGSVTLSLRERFGGMRDHDIFRHRKTFDNWRKTTKKVLSGFYLEGCAAREALSEKVRQKRTVQTGHDSNG